VNRTELVGRLIAAFGAEQGVRAMRWFDEHLDYLEGGLTKKAWTARQVALVTGHKDENGARSWLSRNKIESIRTIRDEDTGRNTAVYPADQVLEAKYPPPAPREQVLAALMRVEGRIR
jgi:hypothetical protein